MSLSKPKPKISDLPDLCLLQVFKNVSVFDLFRQIPLVCTNWTTLQSRALQQRTKLALVDNVYPNINSIPLPRLDDYESWCTPSCLRLLQPSAVKVLCTKIPNISSLQVGLDSLLGISSTTPVTPEDYRLRVAIYDQITRLISGLGSHTSHGWSSQLTTLHLTISEYNSENMLEKVNNLIEAVNRLPCLTVLHFGIFRVKPSVMLTSQTLARLRQLVVVNHLTEWLWRSLCSVGLEEQLQLLPEFSIEFLKVKDVNFLNLVPVTRTVCDHVRKLELTVRSVSNEVSMALHLIPKWLRGLRSLNLTSDPQHRMVDGNDPWLVLATVMRCLSPLTSLQDLKLMGFNLLPIDGESIEEEEEQRRLQSNPMVLPSLQSLELLFFNISSHADLGNALDWPQFLPRLQSLSLNMCTSFSSHCRQCHNESSQMKSMFVIDFFFSEECRRLAIEPLQTCPRLETIVLDNSLNTTTATRADMAAPFNFTISNDFFSESDTDSQSNTTSSE